MWSVLLLLRAFATLQIRLRLMVSRSRGCSARAAPRLRFPPALPVQVAAVQLQLSGTPLLVSIQVAGALRCQAPQAGCRLLLGVQRCCHMQGAAVSSSQAAMAQDSSTPSTCWRRHQP